MKAGQLAAILTRPGILRPGNFSFNEKIHKQGTQNRPNFEFFGAAATFFELFQGSAGNKIFCLHAQSTIPVLLLFAQIQQAGAEPFNRIRFFFLQGGHTLMDPFLGFPVLALFQQVLHKGQVFAGMDGLLPVQIKKFIIPPGGSQGVRRKVNQCPAGIALTGMGGNAR